MGNICCSEKEELLVEHSKQELPDLSRPVPRLVIACHESSDSEGEELTFRKV